MKAWHREALELREQGLSYGQIAKRLKRNKSTVGKTIWRHLVDADRVERDRAASRRWKAANRNRLQAYDREYDVTHRKVCKECGGETSRQNHCGLCLACLNGKRRRDLDAEAKVIETLWAEGVPFAEIARRVGRTKGSLAGTMDRLRHMGYDLPYRYAAVASRNREQVAA